MRHLMLDIARLHEAFGHPVRRVPLTPDEVNDSGGCEELQQRLLMRLRLVAEEFFELIEGALGLGGSYRNWYTEATMATELTLKEWQPDYDYNAIETADALTDLVVVIVGMALELGIPIDRTWNEVQRANMAKAGPDGRVTYRDDGKVLKPEGWTPPDIKTIMQSDPPIPTRGEVKLSRAVILAQTRVGKIDDALTPLVRELLPRLQADLAVLRGALVIGEDEEWEGHIVAGLDLDDAGQEELELRLRAHENALQPLGARRVDSDKRLTKPIPENIDAAVESACARGSLLDALTHIAVWEMEHVVKQAREKGTWDSCFGYCFSRVMKEWEKPNPRKEAMGRFSGKGSVSVDFDAPMELRPSGNPPLTSANFLRGVPCRKCCNCHVEDGWCSHHEQQIRMPGGACDDFVPNREFLENMLRTRNYMRDDIRAVLGKEPCQHRYIWDAESTRRVCRLCGEDEPDVMERDGRHYESGVEVPVSPQKPLDKLVQKAGNVVKAHKAMAGRTRDDEVFAALWQLREAYEAWEEFRRLEDAQAPDQANRIAQRIIALGYDPARTPFDVAKRVVEAELPGYLVMEPSDPTNPNHTYDFSTPETRAAKG